MATFLKSKVLKNEVIADKFHSLQLEFIEDISYFHAGQFVVLKVKDGVYRSYSISSTPKNLPYWEMLVDVSPQGPGTQYLQNIKPGEVIETSKPCGAFGVRGEEGINNFVFGATGCGLAPIKPMIEELLKNQTAKIKLFWGLRFEKDLCFQEELAKWKKANPNFDYQIVISKPENDWNGLKGHINQDLSKYVQNNNPQNTEVYLCGNSQMVEEIKQLLSQSKFPYDKIFYEKYGC